MPQKATPKSTDIAECDEDVELNDVNQALLFDPIVQERISNYSKIIRLNSEHVNKLSALITKVSFSMFYFFFTNNLFLIKNIMHECLLIRFWGGFTDLYVLYSRIL